MVKYRLYVDEVGDTGLKHVNDINHRFLSLTGVIAESDYVRYRIHPQLEDIKVRYFDSHPDEPVVLHRPELINAKWPFHALKDPATRADFDTELLALLHDWSYEVITISLDKQAFVKAGLSVAYDPYHYCLTVLMERFVGWLIRHGSRGDVMVEARLGKEDRELKRYFRGLYENGAKTVPAEQFQNALTSRNIKPKTKAMNISGLQIADLIAHPSRNEIVSEQGAVNMPLGHFANRIVALLADKYEQVGDSKCGKVLVP